MNSEFLEEFLNTNLTSGVCEFVVLSQNVKKTDETFEEYFGLEVKHGI